MLAIAKWMGVAPWELIDRPAAWLFYAEGAMEAEGRAQKMMETRAARRARSGKGKG